jgi:pimeloyl-ACP methyl ester carboxylesterase
MSEPAPPASGAPPLPLFLLEGQRALVESLTLPACAAWLRRAPRGDGHSVLVLPGFMAGDESTQVLRRYLSQQALRAHPWQLGRNRGPDAQLRDRLARRVEALCDRDGRPISIVGWSLGGIYARELAKRLPGRVRQVVTLGSPFADPGRATNVSRLFEWVSGRAANAGATRGGTRGSSAAARALRAPPDVPSTAIFSRTDGVAHWRACREPETDHTENIEIPGSHCGLGFNALALFAVADRLSQPHGAWRPFDRSGWRGLVYR